MIEDRKICGKRHWPSDGVCETTRCSARYVPVPACFVKAVAAMEMDLAATLPVADLGDGLMQQCPSMIRARDASGPPTWFHRWLAEEPAYAQVQHRFPAADRRVEQPPLGPAVHRRDGVAPS
jgi:hypothetical protein